MKQKQQRQLDALHRIRDLLLGETADLGALQESDGWRQLDDELTRLAVYTNDQGTAGRQMAGQLAREQALVLELKTRYMRPIAMLARARLRGVPDFAALAMPLARMRARQLVHAARTMASAAAPHAAALARGGFPPDMVEQLAVAADRVSAVLEERANTRVRRVTATKGIEQSLLAGREAAAMLHAVISHRRGGDPVFLAAWHTALRVVEKPGLPRGAGGISTPAAAPMSVMAASAPAAEPGARRGAPAAA
jgi:hypothetical protein